MAIGKFGRKRSRGDIKIDYVDLGTLYRYDRCSGRLFITIPVWAHELQGTKDVIWDTNHDRTWGRQHLRRNNLSLLPHDVGDDLTSFHIYDETGTKYSGTWEAMGIYTRDVYSGGFCATQWPNTGLDNEDLLHAGTKLSTLTGEYGTATELGPSAWRRFKPKLYVADMGQFLGEIRETLPMLRTTAEVWSKKWIKHFSRAKGSARDVNVMSKRAANQWVNLQFGWRPFVSDLWKFVNSFTRFDTRLQQCIRDNGRNIRRGGLIESTMDNPADCASWTSCGRAGKPSYCTPCGTASIAAVGTNGLDGRLQSTVTYTEKYKIWFSACFRYWVPEFQSPTTLMHKLKNVLRMYGLRVTPTLIWNLTPWSWLVDWSSNVGDNISNYTSINDINLTAKYAYIMKTTEGQWLNETRFAPGGGYPINMKWRRGFIAKTRRHASPFGFTIDPPDFSARQWSILAALGLSRFNVDGRHR